MKPIRAANGIIIERAPTIRMFVADMISDDCSICLDDDQYPIFVRALDKIEALREVDFVLHACIDQRPGHHVRWHSGSSVLDAAVDEIMRGLIHDLGFSVDIKEPVL